jgi:hypothetical protein
MGCNLFDIHLKSNNVIEMSDHRNGRADTTIWQTIADTLLYFVNHPHRFSAWKVYNNQYSCYYITPGMCVVTHGGCEAIFDGEPITICGTTVPYSFDAVDKMLTQYETTITRNICQLAIVIRDHPDFYITDDSIYLRDYGRNSDVGRWIVYVHGNHINVRNMFGRDILVGSLEIARDELYKLLLALNPTLMYSEKVEISALTTAYPHLLIDGGKIIPVGGIYEGEPYSFERFKK